MNKKIWQKPEVKVLDVKIDTQKVGCCCHSSCHCGKGKGNGK
jgi:hypothetical protein